MKRTEYSLADISDEDYLSLMDDEGNMMEHLKVPDGELGDSIRAAFEKSADDGSEVLCAVVEAMGNEAVLGYTTKSA